jgi:hypothetical protein
MPWLHYIAYGLETIAYAISALLWWKASDVYVPIVSATWAGIGSIEGLSTSVKEASQWNKRAAIAAAVGAVVHIAGMIL